MEDEQEIAAQAQKIFKSRISLYFFDERLNNEYKKYEENCLEKSISKNVILTILLMICAILNIAFYKTYNEPNKVVIIYSICLGINCISMFVIIFNKFKKYFSEKNFNILKIIVGINYFILEINFFLSLWFFKLENSNYEFLTFLSSISTTFKIIYIYVFQANFKVILLSTVLSIFFEIIIVTNYPLWITVYPIITNYLILMTCLVLSYYEDFREKINFLFVDRFKTTKDKYKFYVEFCEKQKDSMISIYKSSKFTYANNSMFKLLNRLGLKDALVKSTKFSRKDKLQFENINYLNYYLKNIYFDMGEKNFCKNSMFADLNKFEDIFSDLIYVNEKLASKNKYLYDWLLKIQNSRNNRIRFKFNFEEFFYIVTNKENQKMKLNSQLESQPNQTLYNNTNFITKESAILLDHKQNFILNINSSVLNERKTNLITDKKDIYFLGKLSISRNSKIQNLMSSESSENVELFLYFTLVSKCDEICFVIENNSKLLELDREETAKVCKSLYLSKISHEFKNPISNIIEISNLLNDEVQNLKHEGANTSTLDKFKQSLRSDRSSSDESSKKTSKNENFENKLKTIKVNLNYLKVTADMMLQIVKDFTFYSHSNYEYQTEKSVTQHNGNVSSIEGLPESLNSFYSPLPDMSSKNIFLKDKNCEYRQVINQVIEIFNTKATIDDKNTKMSFDSKYEINLPKIIEFENDKFYSLIFNLLYHIYKSVTLGRVLITVSNQTSKNFISKNSQKILFEIKISGMQNNISDLKNDLISEKDDESNSKEGSDRSEILVVKREEKSRSQSVTSLKMENLQDKIPLASNFHLNQILNITNLIKRNIIIDNFNNNFHYFLSVMYSKILGVKLDVNNEVRGVTKISFTCEVSSHLFPASKFSSSTMLNPSQEKSKQSFDNLRVVPRMKLTSVKVTEKKDIVKQRRNTISNIGKSVPNLYEVKNSTNMTDDSVATKKTVHQNFFNYPYYIVKDANVREMCLNSVDNSYMVYSNFENTLVENTINEVVIKKQDTNFLSHNIVHKKRKSVLINPTPIEQFEMKFVVNNRSLASKHLLKRNETYKSFNSLHNSSLNLTCRLDSQRKAPTLDNFCKVLLCDDENLIRKTLQRNFNLMAENDPSLNFDVQHAENGFECLSLIYDYYNDGKYFDFLIIDETMPFMKGSQVINLLKSMIRENNFKDITIVSYTSYDSPDKREFLFSQGADYVLAKPMKHEDFKNFFNLNLKNKINDNI